MCDICDTKTKIRKSKGTHYFGVAGNNMAVKLAHVLYGDSHIYLDRKHERYLQMCKTF